MKIKLISWSILLIGIISCNYSVKSVKPKTQPKDLNGAMDYINKNFNTFERYKFKNTNEEDAVSDLYFSVGLWMRNNWIRGNRDTALVNYFHSIGAFNPDDISAIILTSLHRKLNNAPINLIQQVNQYKAYWKRIYDCEELEKVKAVNSYNRFKVGDPIVIFMAVDTADSQRNAVTYQCPLPDWVFNPKKDLKIGGIVVDKYFINSDSNVFFKVRIKSMNSPNTRILMDTVQIGGTKDFSLAHLEIM